MITAWIAFNNLEKNQLNIINNTIPSLVDSQLLVEQGGLLSNKTSQLFNVDTIAELTKAWLDLEKTSKILQQSLTKKGFIESQNSGVGIDSLLKQLHLNLMLIHSNIKRSLEIKQHLFEIKIRLEWLKNDLLDELNPLIEDHNFNLQSSLRNRIYDKDMLQQQIDQLTIFTNLRSQINLIYDIVIRVVDSKNDSNVLTSELYIAQIIQKIQLLNQQLSSTSTLITLKQSMAELFKLLKGPESLFLKTKIQLELLENSRHLALTNQQLLQKLNENIKHHAIQQQQLALQYSQTIFKQTQAAQWSLIIIFIISVSLAIIIAWFYVKRSLVFRIQQLNDNMLHIAQGEMATQIATLGNDEISSMAQALHTFRNTLIDTQNELVQAGKLAALGQLSAGVAHELNQPLAAIRNYCHNSKVLIQRDNPQQALEAINKIDLLSETMAHIITQFKAFSRKSKPEVSNISLSEVINNVITLLEGKLEKEAINLTLPPLIGNLKIKAELIRLEQVIVNLMTNAMDALKTRDTKNIIISIQIDKKKNTLLLSIKDNGVGIKEKHKGHVFEPFFSTKESKGLGLGLSISYNIMKDFNGSLELNRHITQGCEFILHIPLGSNA